MSTPTKKRVTPIATILTASVASAVLLVGGAAVAAPQASKAAKAPTKLKVTMNEVSPDGVGKPMGSVTLKQTKAGVDLMTDLSGLAPGEHGFHVHEHGSCAPGEKDGKKGAALAAGGHWDPQGTKAHKGPGGGGHEGDLPKLTVPANGKVKTTLKVAGVKLADLEGKALMIHADGDNYSDQPKPLGGGGARVACGVIPGGEPAAPAAAAPANEAAKPAPAPAKAPKP